LFDSHSIQDNNIGDEGVIKLSEALESNTSLTELYLNSYTPYPSFDSHSLNTGTDISNKAAAKLCEALKSNFSLTSLDVSCNKYL
jgi:hypothetical protein